VDNEDAKPGQPASGLETRLYRKHLLVQNANDANAVCPYAVKNHVFALLVSVKARAYRIAGTAHSRILRKKLEAVSQA
jgi:hypothetical protein